MLTKLHGGAYDGLEMDGNQLVKLCRFHPIERDGKPGLLMFLPQRKDWEKLLNGEINMDTYTDTMCGYIRRWLPEGGAEFHEWKGD